MRNEILRSKKPQVYAQRLVGTHKKLQQADTEPFQVRVVCACKKKLLHQRSSLRSDACKIAATIYLVWNLIKKQLQAVQFIPGVPGSGNSAAK